MDVISRDWVVGVVSWGKGADCRGAVGRVSSGDLRQGERARAGRLTISVLHSWPQRAGRTDGCAKGASGEGREIAAGAKSALGCVCCY